MVMKKAGQVVVIKFPQTDYQESKSHHCPANMVIGWYA